MKQISLHQQLQQVQNTEIGAKFPCQEGREYILMAYHKQLTSSNAFSVQFHSMVVICCTRQTRPPRSAPIGQDIFNRFRSDTFDWK